MSLRATLLCLCLAIPSWQATADDSADRLALRDGDRVVWIGGSLIEREQTYGYCETMLTASNPGKKVTFRNLGWSGDTVWADSRGMFDAPAQGYARMLELVKELKPTLVIFAYGGNEAFAGDAGIERFVKQFQKLIKDLEPTGARFAFLLPIDMDPQVAPYAEPAQIYNQQVVAYRDALRRLAKDLKAPVIDLTKPAAEESQLKDQQVSPDGVNLNAFGYWALAHRLRDQCNVTKADVSLTLPADAWPTSATPTSSDRLERIRELVVRKNEQFFHRWRPQNFTYIFGFRKHEQGNNAVEIPQFDPVVENYESQIAELNRG